MDFQTGLCECGCGESAPIATITNTAAGRVAGQPSRFIRGHNSRVRIPTRRSELAYRVDAETGCWLWQRCLQSGGYGRVWDGEKVVQAHRFYYAQKFGDITSEIHLHHTCETRSCVNPDHMEPFTNSEHRRMHAKRNVEILRLVRESGLSVEELAALLGVV